MDRLTSEDLRRILDLVGELGEVEDPVAFSEVTLEGVMDLVPCEVASLNEVLPASDRVLAWTRPVSFEVPEGVDEALARLAPSHPLIHHIASTGDGSAHRISDFWDRQRFRSSELYEHVYRPMGVEYQMAVALPVPRPAVVGLALNRARRDFSDRDVAALEATRPHLVRGWRAVRDRVQLRSMLAAAGDALRSADLGAIVLHNPPEELAPGTLAAVHRHFGPPSGRGAFSEIVQDWLRRSEDVQLHHPLLVVPPLETGRSGRRAVLRYLAPARSHPG
ncbi:MAG TPA: hypothetical protein VMD59_15290, partial [Acidimicrobiales bacterium]|nr:hypothetical protein [Acidimicrobiales bacterium]